MLVFDLDTARAGAHQVVTDSERLLELIQRCGGNVVMDESPSGGRHLYLPLAQPISFHDARDLALDLALTHPSMDTKPNHNLTDGLIRPPGSVHPSGGFQTLVGSLKTAAATATHRNPPAVWSTLRTAVPRSVKSDLAGSPAGGDDQPVAGRQAPARPISKNYLNIATTGIFDEQRYASPSDARQAVITAAANAGMTLNDVLGRLAGGVWPGLASFYARYRAGHRAKAVRSDWDKAIRYLAKHPAQKPNDNSVHKSPTSDPSSHPPAPTADLNSRKSSDEYLFLRTWWSALRTSTNRWSGRQGLARRMALRALGEAGMKSGSRYVAFGTRSLSVAAGVDHTTIAAHLRALRDEPDPFLVLLEDNRGLAGDLYELRIPDGVTERAHRAAWPAGRMHALRPAFRDLGLCAAAVYEVLETVRGPRTSFDISTLAGVSRSAAYEALETLAAWNLASPDSRGHWSIVRTTCLDRLAESWGIADTIRQLITRHRTERAAYRKALRIPDDPYADIALIDWSPPQATPPPPSTTGPPTLATPMGTALELLERELGASRI